MAKIKDIMTPGPTTAMPGTSLQDLAKMMRDEDVGSVPVVEGGKLVGIVTDRDIVIRAIAEGRTSGSASDVMSGDIVSLKPDDAVKKAKEMMSKEGVRRLPVCDGDRIVGIVSVGDLAVEADSDTAGKVMEETGPR